MRSLTLHRKLRFACLALGLATCGTAFAQSSDVSQSARAFYRGEYARAAELAARHLRRFPNDAAARVILARVDLAQGNFQEAFESLQKALAYDARNVDALYYLSIVSRELSHREYQRLLSLAPDSARAHQLLGEAAVANENRTEAEAEFTSALTADPRSVEVLVELAELKRSQSKFDEAITYYTRAQQIGPTNYDIAYGMGACYTYKQDYAQAIAWLREAVTSDPDSAAGHFALGNALFQSGQWDAAIPELNYSLKLEPRLKQAYFLLGRAYAKTGRQEEAKAALQKLDELVRSEIPSAKSNGRQKQ